MELLSLTDQPELPPPLQRNPAIAFWLSLFMPGAGHFYIGLKKSAYWTFGVFGVCLGGIVLLSRSPQAAEYAPFLGVLLRTAICIYLFAFFDAFFSAQEVSSGRDRFLPNNPRVAAVLNLTTRGFGYFYIGERKLGFTVFVVLLVALQVVRASGMAPLELVLEIVLACLAVHAFRMAVRLNPLEETLPPIPEETKCRKLRPVVYGLAGIIVLGYAGLAVLGTVASVLVPDYSRIDQTQAKLDVQHDTTIYENPKYGVSLRLAGIWVPQKIEAAGFCSLMNQDLGVMVLFSAEGVLPITSLDSFSKKVALQITAAGGATLEDEQVTEVGGMEARRLTFLTRRGDMELRQGVLLVKKGASVYAVWVMAPAALEENWSGVLESLPRAVSIH